ncbi:MAG: DNA-3-methyladenine glycosylase [bacterium]|nr:DNA-3-methyladenine glycosylase [bacterium]
MKILNRKFYAQDTVDVARNLLGKVLVFGDKQGTITEVEAYLGDDDPACHAFGRLTERKKIFFGPPGIAYVFLAYGMHWCFNVITEPVGKAGCVLIQGINDTFGPGRISKLFGFNGEHNGLDITSGPITICEGSHDFDIEITPRIGLSQAVDWPLRFVAKQANMI